MSYLRKTTWARKAGLVLLDALLICAATYIALTLRYEAPPPAQPPVPGLE